MGRTSQYSLQAQALQRFEKNASTIKILEKSVASPRRASVALSNQKTRKTFSHGSRNTVLNPRLTDNRNSLHRNVTLMRAIYSEARWRMHAGVFQHQVAQPAESAASVGSDSDAPAKSQQSPTRLKLKGAVKAVCDSAKQVCRGQRSLLTWQRFHEEEIARKMIEEVKKDLEEGKLKTWEDTEEHISGVMKQLFKEGFSNETDETKQLMASFNEAADSFKELQARLDTLRQNSTSVSDALQAMRRRAQVDISSVTSQLQQLNNAKQDIERIRRQSVIDEKSLTFGEDWKDRSPTSSSHQGKEPSSPPGPKPLKRAIIRKGHTTADEGGFELHTAKRSEKRSSTERFASRQGSSANFQHDRSKYASGSSDDEVADSFFNSIAAVRANLKVALLAKRAAKKIKKSSEEPTDENSDGQDRRSSLEKDEEAVERLDELIAHAAMQAFQGGDEELQGSEMPSGLGQLEEEGETLLAFGDALESVDEFGSPDEGLDGSNGEGGTPASKALEEGMEVIVDGMKGRLQQQTMGFWSVLCEDGEIRVFQSDRITTATDVSAEDKDYDFGEDDKSAEERVTSESDSPPTGYHGKRRASWQRARAKLKMIQMSSVLLGHRHHELLPLPTPPANTDQEQEEEAQKAKEAGPNPASYASWQRQLMQSDDLDWNGPLHLMEEHAGPRSQTWRHHLALLAAHGGSGGIEAIVADRHKRNFIIRSATGPETDGSADGVEVHLPPPRFACGNSPLSSVVPPLPATPPPSGGAKAFGRSLDGPLAGSARIQARTAAPGTVHGPLREHPEHFSLSVGEQRWPPLFGTTDDIITARPSRSRGGSRPRGSSTMPGLKAAGLQGSLWRMNLVTVEEPWSPPRVSKADQRQLRSR